MNNQARLSADSVAWQAFIDSPARFIGPRQLHDCLGDIADDATQRALALHPRFQQRITQRLVQHYALTQPRALPAPKAEDLPLFMLSPDAGETLTRYCGTIYHAMAFVREIRAPRVIELKTRFGEGPFAAALSNRELAIHGLTYRDDDALQQALLGDGAACLSVWLAQQPAELAAWLRLGLASDLPPLDTAISTEIHERGANITRRAATALLANTSEDPA